MHFRTHVKPELRGISAKMNTPTVWSNTTVTSAKFLKTLDDLGIVDNTIVFYSTDNGPHYNTWPDAAATPFRGEKTPTGKVAGGAFHGPLAGQNQARQLVQCHHAPHGLVADFSGCRRRAGHQGEAQSGWRRSHRSQL
ncbi:MAG: sulfatase-like hydrolase/transferase [Candidatus Competibacteraceae bacterium]